MQQYGSKYLTHRSRPTSRDPGVGLKGQKSTFSEHGHVAYQIKWHHKSSNIITTILPTDHIKRVKRSKFNFFRTWSCCISNNMESRMQQNGSKKCVRRPPPRCLPNPGVQSKGRISTCSEHGHVAYRIKWNRKCSNMQAHIMSLHTPSIPGVGPKVKLLFF